MQEKRWSRHRSMLARMSNPVSELSTRDRQDIEKKAVGIAVKYVGALRLLKNDTQRSHMKARIRLLIKEMMVQEGLMDASSTGDGTSGK